MVNGHGLQLMEEVPQQVHEVEIVFAEIDNADLGRRRAGERGEGSGTAAPPHDDDRHAPPSATVVDVLELLYRAERSVALLGEPTYEKLESVPVKANRFADGHRKSRQVIPEMASHQAAHLAAVERALA